MTLTRTLTIRGENLVVRPLAGLDEMRACVELQELTWGVGFSQRVPLAMLKVTQRLGGVTAGAFDGAGTLIGFVYGVTGLERGEAVHWSDMLAVLPEWQGSGLGYQLKLYQKDFLLAMGVRRMFWTFDPLVSRNAHLNLHRLGAVSREYAIDMYGNSNSPLHQGMGTDRFVALWEMDSSRVTRRTTGEGPPDMPPLPDAFQIGQAGGLPEPGRPHSALAEAGWTAEGSGSAAPQAEPLAPARNPPARNPPALDAPDLPGLMVPIPADIQTLKDRNLELAAHWRSATRAVLAPALAAGWEVREFYRGANVSRYLLVPADSTTDD